MPTPVSETIIADVTAAIEGVTVQAGYHHTLRWVGRFNRHVAERPEVGPGDLRPCVLLKYVGDTGGEPGQYRIRGTARIIAQALIDYDDDAIGGPDVQLNTLGVDLVRAVTEMGLDEKEYFFSGWDTTSLHDIDSEEPEDGVLVTLDFRYVVNAESIGSLIA